MEEGLQAAPDLSVVIPCFNEAPDSISRTVQSVVETVPDADIILVDDGSEEPVSPPVIAEAGDDGPDGPTERLVPLGDVRVIRLDTNRGPAAALNLGYDAAQRALIARLDVGDVWYPEAKRAQIEAALTVPASFAASFDEEVGTPTPVRADWASRIYTDNQFQASTTIVDRRVWRALPFDEDLRWCDDWDWHMRVQHLVGWSRFDAITGTATCWPTGHNKRVVDEAREAAKRRCRATVYKRGLELAKREWNGIVPRQGR